MDFDPQHMILIAALALVGHVALFALYRIAHPVMLLMAAFIVASLLSTAEALPGVVLMKYARVYFTLLAVVIGVFCIRAWQFGPASRALLMFVVLYLLAALWSEDPIGGLLFKGLFLLTVLVGMAGVFVAQDERRLWTLQHSVVLAAGLLAVILSAGLLRNPGMLISGARLSLFGLNPNRIAETFAPLLVFCFFGVLYDPVRMWRIVAYVVALPVAALLLATGSRAGFGQAMLGFMLLALPLVRRPAAFTTVCVVLGVGGLFVLGLVEESRAYQLDQYDFSSRGAPWAGALEIFRASPLVGIGWARMSSGQGWATSVNMHSIYLQVLVEMGIVGALVMVACLTWLGRCAWRVYRATAGQPTLRPMCFFAVTLGLTALAHGVAESGGVMGSSLNAMSFGVSAALLDWLYTTARTRSFFAAAPSASISTPLVTPQVRS